MADYPNISKIRTTLNNACGKHLANRFDIEALKVLAEAEREGGIFMDVQMIAKLQFIEKVLNG